MPDTTDASSAPDGQGENQSTGTGGVTPTPTPEGKTFTQDQVNEIVKARLAEERTKLTSKFEKDLETKIAEAASAREKAFETQVADRVKAALAERDLADTRRAIQSEYGLTDVQLARLTGETPDDLKADAETLFGALKQRKPPVLNPGAPPAAETVPDLAQMSPAQIREKSAELLRTLRA
jgi:hypothetical protein